MRKYFLSVVLFFSCVTFLSSQNKIWYFGSYLVGTNPTSYGLDFTNGSPVQINGESGMDFYESVSVVSDNDGNVLYYTDGVKLFDGSHKIMYGAPAELKGPKDGSSGTAVQGAYSVLKPGSESEYFLFTSQGIDGAANGFRVNRIDMSLPGNGTALNPLGELVTLDSLLLTDGSELMTAYGDCGSDTVWVITHSPNSYNFVSVLITSGGIQKVDKHNVPTPTANTTGFLGSRGRGSMDINSTGDALIYTAMEGVGSFIFEFDKNSGIVSQPTEIKIPSAVYPFTGTDTYQGYGCEFSPDGTKAYFCSMKTAHGTARVWQYDIDAKECFPVPNSDGLNYGEIITGPDNKLYFGKVSQESKSTVGVMENPNNSVSTVDFDPNAINFGGTTISYAMPQGFFCDLNPCTIEIIPDEQCIDDGKFIINATPADGKFGGGDYINNITGEFDPEKAGVGTYWVTYDAGCDKPDSTQVIVKNCCPDIDPNLGDDVTICGNIEKTLNVVGAFPEIKWFKDGVLQVASTGKNDFVASSGTYRVEVENAEGCTGSDEIIISAHAVPNPTIIGDDFYCAGSDVTLEVAAGFDDYDWSPSGGGGNKATINSAGTFTVTVKDDNGCIGTDDIDIIENELPTIDLGGDKTLCGTDSITLDATHDDASTYLWTLNSEDSPTIRVSSENATYGVTIEDVDGCEFSTSIDVTEENTPTVDIGGDAIICDNVTKTLDAGSGSGYSYTWYLDDGLLPNDGQTIDADSGIYRVVVSTENGCEASDTAYLDNHQLPKVTLNSDYEFCAGDSVNVDAGPNGRDYSWNNEETAQSFFVKTGGSLTVEIIDGNNCTNKATATITENALPVVNLAASDSACEGREIELDVTLPNGKDYKWSDGTSGPTNTQIGPGTISVVVTNEKGCVDSAEMVVKELDPLDMSAFDDKHQVCFGMEEETPYVAGSFEEAVYDWTLPDGGLEEGQSIVPYLNGSYTLNVTDKFNCIGTHEFENAVIRVPFIDLGPDTSFCSVGKGIYNVRMEIEDMNVKGKLTWEDSYGRTDNNNENDTIFTVKDAPITIFGTLTDDETGCYTGDTVFLDEFCLPTDDDHVDICIIGHPAFPAGCRPTYIPGGDGGDDDGGDGGNDGGDVRKDPTNGDVWNHILWSDYEVYNRWGLKVFQSKDLLPSWDGYFENERAASGVYYFVYRYEDSSRKVYHKNGFFQLSFFE